MEAAPAHGRDLAPPHFAIISHPTRAKTTLTEKLLLYGGAIHVAGAVRGPRGGGRPLGLDGDREAAWHLGVTSVLQFDSAAGGLNLLDTPAQRTSARTLAPWPPPTRR